MDFDGLHLAICYFVLAAMIVSAIGAAAKETGNFSDGSLSFAVVVIAKSQFVLHRIRTVLVIFVAVAVGCVFTDNGEDVTYGVGNNMVFLLL